MIRIDIDDKLIRKAFAAAPTLLARELSAEVQRFIRGGTSDFSKDRLRAKDDRNRGDFLLRRPPKSMGLRRVTGQVGAARYQNAPPATKIGDIKATTGFLTGKAARIKEKI